MNKLISADIYQRRDGLTVEKYKKLYQESIEDPEGFWGGQAGLLNFYHPWRKVLWGDWSKGEARWFDNARLNVCYNCVDRHVPLYGDEVALIWQADSPAEHVQITYRQLQDKVSRCANVLLQYGVKKGDMVGIYLPMIPEAIIAILACTRIGAVHCVIFAGFSAEALASRLSETECHLVITADEGLRGGKVIPLKKQVDKALEHCSDVKTVLVVKRTGKKVEWFDRDVAYETALQQVNASCECVEMQADDPLFVLYTSGSTGKPKGIVHTTAGYLLYSALSFKVAFDYQPGDIYWCTADVGWITGHSYGVYGPLANRATILVYEGIPTYPDAGRFWQIIDQHQVNIFYTAPTAIRSLMREDDIWVKQSKRDSLRILGTVGEPINPAAWQWYFEVIGEKRCPILDTWWQTETGGFMITPVAGITPLKPGCATQPFWGVKPAIKGKEKNLVITQSWPGFARTIYKNHQRFIDTYLKPVSNAYFTGDSAQCDADGDYWITGRVDDVINPAGHRLSTAEIENAIVHHTDIAEAAVVGFPHEVKGEGIYAFVIPKANVKPSEDLKKTLIQQVVESIGSFAKPNEIQFTDALPKTRSGKIMRRILRKIASGEKKDFGDISTLADPKVVEELCRDAEEKMV